MANENVFNIDSEKREDLKDSYRKEIPIEPGHALLEPGKDTVVRVEVPEDYDTEVDLLSCTVRVTGKPTIAIEDVVHRLDGTGIELLFEQPFERKAEKDFDELQFWLEGFDIRPGAVLDIIVSTDKRAEIYFTPAVYHAVLPGGKGN